MNDLPIGMLFTKTDKLLSQFIMFGLQEPASHFAIDVPLCDRIIHSDLLGVHVAPRAEFMASHTIVDTVRLFATARTEAIIQSYLMRYADTTHADYDFGSFFSLTLSGFNARVFGTPMPRHPRWGNDREFLCTEMAYFLNQAVVEATGKPLFSYQTDLGAMSPWMLRDLIMKETGGKHDLDLRPMASIRA